MVTKLLLVAATAAITSLFPLDQKEAKVTKVNFSESMRLESMTEQEDSGSSSSSTTRSACKGKFTVVIELSGNFADMSSSTGIGVSIGKYAFDQTLGADRSFTAGKTNVTLRQYGNEQGVNRTVAATAKLNWSKDKLTFRIDGETPRAHSIIVEDLTGQLPGGLDAETKVNGHVGSVAFEAEVPVKGKLSRKSEAKGNISGSVTIVDVHGKL